MIARLALAVLTVVCLAAPPVWAELAEKLQAVTAAQDAGDDEAMVKALDGLAKAYNASDDDSMREEILTALGFLLLDEDEFPKSRPVAARVLGDLKDRAGAWYELEGFMPTADQTNTGAFEHAVVVAAGKLNQGEVLDQLLEFAREAADDKLAAAAVTSLAAFDKSTDAHQRVTKALMDLAATLLPDEAADAQDKARWAALRPPLVATLRTLTGRKKASAKDFAAQGTRGRRTTSDGSTVPPGPTPPDKAPDPTAPTKTTPWEQLFANFKAEEPGNRLGAVDEVFDRELVGDDVRGALIELVEIETDWRVLSMALRCLAFQDTMDEPAARMLKHKKHRIWQVRLALAEGLLAYRHLKGVETLIDLLGDKRMRVRDEAGESLYKLTGKDLGVVQKRWAKWLREQKGIIRFIPPKHRPKDYGTVDRDKGYAFAYNRFFGTRIRSDRVMLVLDKSESMYYGLWDQTVLEVEMFLGTALPTTFFGVVEFDAKPRIWQKRLAPANDKNADDVLSFLKRAKPYGPTNVMDSMRQAMNVRDVDTVVLLSDGVPNRGNPRDPAPILAQIRRTNRYTRIGIHTLQMELGRRFEHDGPRGEDKPPLDEKEKLRRERVRAGAENTALGGFLKRMADENDGTFGVVFADWYAPPPDAQLRDGTDK